MTPELLQAYRAAKDAVSPTAAWPKIERYKRLHAAYSRAVSPSFEDEQAVSRLYWELMLDDRARAFIASERALVEGLAAGMSAAVSGCDIDFDFLSPEAGD